MDIGELLEINQEISRLNAYGWIGLNIDECYEGPGTQRVAKEMLRQLGISSEDIRLGPAINEKTLKVDHSLTGVQKGVYVLSKGTTGLGEAIEAHARGPLWQDES